MNQTKISLALHSVFNPQGHQLASLVMVDDATNQTAAFHAWITIINDPPPSPRKGRKPNQLRKVAVALAHEWQRAWLNRNQGDSDKAVAELLGYSEESAVRRIRTAIRKEIADPHYLLTFNHHEKSDHRFVLLLEKNATTMQVSAHRFCFQGPGWRWTHSEREAVYQLTWKGEASIDQPLNGQQLAQFRQWAGGGQE